MHKSRCFATLSALLLLAGGRSEAITTPSYEITVLHNFGDGSVANDAVDPSGLTLASDGNFYGVSALGGSANKGTAFKMTPAGTVTILHSFGDGSVVHDGANPSAGLLQASDGNFYGTTSAGGSAGSGTVFRLTSTGTVTILHSFGDGSVTKDGLNPSCRLIQAADGLILGTTPSGGNVGPEGTIFSVTTGGTYTLLKGMTNAIGYAPFAGLVDGKDGFFYGVNSAGGASNNGTVFKVDESGNETLVLNCLATIGKPMEPLMLGADGNLYGSFTNIYNAGVAVKLTKSGTATYLHTFAGNAWQYQNGNVIPPDASASEEFVQDSAGTLYSTSPTGGVFGPNYYTPGYGCVFSMTTGGTVNVIASFNAATTGEGPADKLVLTSGGDLYGTTTLGGSGHGTAFKISAGPVGPTSTFVLSSIGTSTSFIADGENTPINVSAFDLSGNRTPAYSGTVHFTSDIPAILPADSTLNNGMGAFTVVTYGHGNLTATDTVHAGISGTLYRYGETSKIAVAAPATVTAGVPFNFNIRAVAGGKTIPSYGGTIAFSTNASGGVVPGLSTIPNGTGTFSATLTRAGNASANFKISAQDTRETSISGTSGAITVVAAAAKSFHVTVPSTAADGTPFSITVTAYDQYGNIATGYTGTVHITSSDRLAVLPTDGTLTNGVGTFNVTLHTSGPQTITATDTGSSSIHGTSPTITVTSPATYILIAAPSSVTTGTPFNFNVRAADKYNHTAATYAGTLKFYSNTTHITLPGNSTLTHGLGTFQATMTASTSCKISAVDIAISSLHGTSATVTSTP